MPNINADKICNLMKSEISMHHHFIFRAAHLRGGQHL